MAQSDGSTISTTYAGNCTTVVDQALKTRKSCSDALGRLTSILEDPGAAPHLNYETDYQYDGLGNLLRDDQKGDSPGNSAAWRTRLFTYDSLSRLLTATNPESGFISYSYDANGNVTSKVSPKQNQTNPNTTITLSYCYDALNRLTGKAYTAQSCPLTSSAATYTYDQGTNSIGRRTGMTDSPGSSAWNYDLMGHVTSETRVTAGVSKTTGYAYNLDGSVKSVTYPSTRTLSYSYNPEGWGLTAGRPISLIDSTGPINYAAGATYAAFGGLTGVYNGIVAGAFTGIITTNWYNQRLQPCRLSARNTGLAPSPCSDSSHIGNVIDLSYDFHAGNGDNGNVFQIVNNHDGNRAQNFTYDNLNRIQQAYTNGSIWGETFGSQAAPGGVPSTPGIDPWGNLWQRSAVTGKTSYEPLNVSVLTNNQLSGFGYDAAGNITSNGSTAYNYDAENRLTKFITTGTDIYVYDGDGRRVKKNTGPVTLYWYDMAGNVIDETNGSGGLLSEYVYFNGKRVARRDASNNSVHYYFSDHLGSASVVTDASGTMSQCPAANSPMNYTTIPTGEEESDYYPYGGEMKLCDRAPQNYKFTGKERDAESGLDSFGKRFYASTMGRWMSPDLVNVTEDRVVNPANTLNKYIYGGNNPPKYIDPDGQDITYFYDPGYPAGHAVLFAYNQLTGDSAIESFGPKVSLPVWTGESNFHLDEFTSAQGLRDNFASLTIQTTPELTQQVIDYIRANPDPSLWTFAGPNCSSEVAKILKQFKLNNQSRWRMRQGVTPKILWHSLMSRYNPSQNQWGSTPNRGQDYGNPRYDMFNLLWLSLPQSEATVTVTNCVTDSKGKKICDTQ